MVLWAPPPFFRAWSKMKTTAAERSTTKRKRSVPHAPRVRAFLSSTDSAGSKLLWHSMQPRAQPTEVSPACRSSNIYKYLKWFDMLEMKSEVYSNCNILNNYLLFEGNVLEWHSIKAVSSQQKCLHSQRGRTVVLQILQLVRSQKFHLQQMAQSMKI